ncbi:MULTISPECIES: RNA polymerase sigma factor [Butyricimonas]|uniref:RNA polymerase sigma factor n=1 Tax=Butyricimonas TaxID=574697 RepID=UPI000B3A3F12|nr:MULTISPECIES: sigma-70 family RNA polymerase sigma factor [Butyricimonas]OUN64407.1 hypothetical protein B5G13_15665 [Butyricimonas sp. An62]
MMNVDDVLLAKRVTERDEEAFKILYEEFFHALLSVACKYVEIEEARDIVQDTFFKLWSAPQKFLHINDMRFYLYRSVQNQCLNYIRDKKVEDNYRNKTEVITEDYFYNALLEEEIFIRLRQAIDELPEKYRNVINLNLEGLSDKEIAEKLDITIDAVKQQKKRGKEQLKGKLTHPFLLLLINFI